ncbi:MAG: hypothetical protein H0T76_06785 [Nannocystis sp.]|nr:DUF6438 domain-containing protein [Nannocystis sp.]MBA3546168.1 hypothetical protein [Nannocystis sp.]
MRRCLALLLLGACARAPTPAPRQPVPEDSRLAVETPEPEAPYHHVHVFGLDGVRSVLADDTIPVITSFVASNFNEALCERPGELFELLAASPRLEHVRYLHLFLEDCLPQEALAGLAAVDLPALRDLNLDGGIGPRGAAILAGLPLLARLTHLTLPNNPLGRAGVAALGHSPHLHKLWSLNLYKSLLTEDAALALADTPAWTGLRRLNLSYNVLGRAALASLGGNPALVKLKELDVSHSINTADDSDRFSALVRAGGLPKLTVLRIGGGRSGDAGLAALAETGRWPDLRNLDLRSASIGPAGAAALARATHLSVLERLEIQLDNLGPEGGLALAGAPHLAGLRHLDLRTCELDDQAALALVNHLKNPESLVLSDNNIGDAGAAAIAARRDWTRLRTLHIYHSGISDDGAVALAAAPQLADLEELWLDHNKIGERGWRALVGSSTLARFVDDTWRSSLALHDSTLGPDDAARKIPGDLELELSRDSCFGRCPVYSVTLRGDGRLEYRGESYVARVGQAEAHIDRGRIQLILAALEVFVATAPERHKSRSADCKARIADNSNVTLKVRRGGRTRTYATRSICPSSSAWEALYTLANRIDNLLATNRWTYVIAPW